MYKLIKCSRPGWEKEFSEIGALVESLEARICKSCWKEDRIALDEYAGMPDEEKISVMLTTPCGVEYITEGICEREVVKSSMLDLLETLLRGDDD